ncbi:MAG: hypothetical protein QY332_10845 [Anaerolineales bacterium]|nr:MAG: hypothetical protein QY332_10780 [Anaerolineales bacterium]WKZ38427.1 MAG: hypothetical protein QY332_10845 [Anaerolineales bacterium]
MAGDVIYIASHSTEYHFVPMLGIMAHAAIVCPAKNKGQARIRVPDWW